MWVNVNLHIDDLISGKSDCFPVSFTRILPDEDRRSSSTVLHIKYVFMGGDFNPFLTAGSHLSPLVHHKAL